MDSTHIRWLEESLEQNTVQKILKQKIEESEKTKRA
jgi:hypothetical protein